MYWSCDFHRSTGVTRKDQPLEKGTQIATKHHPMNPLATVTLYPNAMKIELPLAASAGQVTQ